MKTFAEVPRTSLFEKIKQENIRNRTSLIQYVKVHRNPRIARNFGELAVQNSAEFLNSAEF
jgi:hypothetical protein